MTITIRLQTDNAAFQDQDGDPRYEVARIVRQIASWFVDDGLYLDGAPVPATSKTIGTN